jgi:hypothetical protein
MIHKFNDELLTSFNLPDRLNVKQLDDYQREMWEMQERYGAKVTTARYHGAIFGAAIEAGIVLDWQSELMPSLDFENADEVDAGVALWAGSVIDEYLEAQNYIPKVTFLRRLTWALGRRKFSRRPHSSKHGAQSNGKRSLVAQS